MKRLILSLCATVALCASAYASPHSYIEADSITDNMQGVNIHVSFGSSAPAMAAYAYRLYIRTDDPTQVMTVMDSMQEVMTDIPAQVVFVTSSRDTRFAQCSVLLPLLAEE